MRARCTGTIATHVSGRLDSSLSSALRPTSAGTVVPRPSRPSHSYPQRPEIDETPYIQDVVRATGVPWMVEAPAFDAAAWRRSVVRRSDFPEFPNDASFGGIRRASPTEVCASRCPAKGAIALTGSFFYYADLLRHGRLVAAFRRMLTSHGRRAGAGPRRCSSEVAFRGYCHREPAGRPWQRTPLAPRRGAGLDCRAVRAADGAG